MSDLEKAFNRFIYNRTKIKPLEELKQSLINTWLPLAINIQGIKDDNKKNLENFFNEIKNEMLIHHDKVLEEWKNIKKIIGEKNFIGLPNLSLPENVIFQIIDYKTIIDDFYRDYLDNNDKFLPHWLNKIVKVIDDEIIRNEQNKSN